MNNAASTELGRLNPFVGLWNTTGEMKNRAPGNSATFKAVDKYEWMPGGQFLLHHFEADMPDGKTQGIEVIGYNPETDSYPMHSFDSTGTTTLMQGQVDKASWTYTGELLRFKGGFREDGNVFGGLWESRSSESASWNPLMEITLRKAK